MLCVSGSGRRRKLPGALRKFPPEEEAASQAPGRTGTVRSRQEEEQEEEATAAQQEEEGGEGAGRGHLPR